MKTLKQQWVLVLWLIIFSLVVVVGLWGQSIPVSIFREMRFWHHWELAALGSSVVYNILFYILGFFLPPKMFLHLNPKEHIGWVVLLMFVAIGFLVWATIISLSEGNCSLQLGCMLLVTISFGFIDFIMGRDSTSDKVKDDFGATLFLSDLPAFVAFLVLFTYSLTYKGGDGAKYDPLFRAFVGGAIAFQMIASNSVLAAIFRKPGEWYKDAID